MIDKPFANKSNAGKGRKSFLLSLQKAKANKERRNEAQAKVLRYTTLKISKPAVKPMASLFKRANYKEKLITDYYRTQKYNYQGLRQNESFMEVINLCTKETEKSSS